MKINGKILHIPPYISTAWKNVVSLHIENEMNQPVLVISMKDGSRISIPNIDNDLLNKIFSNHQKSLETQEDKPVSRDGFGIGFPIKMGMNGIDSLNNPMQHNPQQANMPDLPPEILEKIISITKALGMDQMSEFPKAEPHCNCVYCQIARSLYREAENTDEEIVDHEDLTFREWDIKQTDKEMYVVTNPLDSNEYYNVFLGSPLGCTCGKKHCEHIKAVLES